MGSRGFRERVANPKITATMPLMVVRWSSVRQISRFISLAGALSLLACGKTRGHDGEGGPGTTAARLVAWQLVAEGAPPLTVGVLDSEREQHCQFLPDETGKLRCLPLAPPSLELRYAHLDADCSSPVYRAHHLSDPSSIEGRDVALPLPKQGCEQRYVVGRLRRVASDEARFVGEPGQCVLEEEGALSTDENTHDFVLDERSDPAAWVGAREQDGPLAEDRLRLRQFVAEDESVFDAGLVDEKWSRPCALRDIEERLHCLAPTLSDPTDYFVDASCSGDGLYPEDTCAPAAYLGDWTRPSELFALGEPWTDPVYRKGLECDPLTARPEGQRFVQRGPELGADAVARAEWTREGSDRLRLLGLRGDGGAQLPLADPLFDTSSFRRYPFESHRPRFYDEQLEAGCVPVWTADAGVRCVPETTNVDPYTYSTFADSGCSEPVYMCTSLEGDCAEGDIVLMAYDENGEYRAVSRNATVGLAGATIYSRSSDGCRPNPAGEIAYYKAGEELPFSEYPLLDEVNGRASGAP
jgi:hypothetical protein